MGVVFEAEDIKLGRKAAIKHEILERFEREARSASALNHPNICTVYEIDVVDGQPFIAMELLHGETLGTRLQRGRMEIKDILRLAIEVADAAEVVSKIGGGLVTQKAIFGHRLPYASGSQVAAAGQGMNVLSPSRKTRANCLADIPILAAQNRKSAVGSIRSRLRSS